MGLGLVGWDFEVMWRGREERGGWKDGRKRVEYDDGRDGELTL